MKRPLELPKFVILMSDDSTRKLACDVALHMSKIDHTVYIDDFEMPIYTGFTAMWDRDWGKDYGNPDESRALMLDAIGEKSEAEVLRSLRDWYYNEFGPQQLGKLALQRALAQQELTQYIYVLRDGRPSYIEAFVASKYISNTRDMLLVYLSNFNEKRIIPSLAWRDTPSEVEDIVAAMEVTWKDMGNA